MEVADGLGVFMFMQAILPQERLPVLIDNSIEAIDMLDGRRQMAAEGLLPPAFSCFASVTGNSRRQFGAQTFPRATRPR